VRGGGVEPSAQRRQMARMSLRSPTFLRSLAAIASGADDLATEIRAEKAASLERAGLKAERALAALNEAAAGDERRPALAAAAAEALHGYFIQRELMGFRSHAEVVERLKPPREVLAKVGAR
jgi:hypothetical protein